jgi:nitrogenase subunit NifH
MKLKTLILEAKKIMLSEAETVTLAAICDNGELWDEREYISNFSEHANDEFTVQIMPHAEIKKVMTNHGDKTVLQAFRDHAASWQKKLVADKVKNYDNTRIVVMNGNSIVDGNHHLVATYKAKKDLKFIDLEEKS